MNVFGTTQPKIIQLDLDEDQFHLYAKISKNYNHTFLFESLAGPEILAETSVMGFDPKKVIQIYLDRIEINQDTVTQIVETDDPFTELRSHLRDSNDQEYRYLGGAVGSICYTRNSMVMCGLVQNPYSRCYQKSYSLISSELS